MKYLFKLALRNILRSKRRTILTLLVLAFGVMMYIYMACLLKGFGDVSTRNLIEFDTGHFKVRSLEFETEQPLIISNFMNDYKEVEKVLDTKDYIVGHTERINFLAEADNGMIATPVIVTGIDMKTDPKVFTLTNFIEKGSLAPNNIILGKGLAKDLEVAISDSIFITFRDANGMMTSMDYLISGIVNAPDPKVNFSTIYLNISDAKKLLNSDSVTEIAIKTKDVEKVDKYAKDLIPALPKHKVEDWKILGRDMIALMEAKSGGTSMFSFFIVVVALAGIINTLLLSVYEKRREIGMLKAMGMTDRDVQRLFIFEGIIIGLLGALLGVALGALANLHSYFIGWDFGSLLEGMEDMDMGYRVSGVVKSGWDIPAFFNAIIISFIASLLASFLPARKTVKMQAMECLRINQ